MSVWTNRALIVLGALGLFISGVLSYTTWKGLQIPCGGKASCLIVQTSQWSKLGDVSVSYIGLAGYLALFALAIARTLVGGKAQRSLGIAGFVMSAIGLLYSVFLTFVSVAFIGQTCVWCLASLSTMILLTVGHALLLQSGTSEGGDTAIGSAVGAGALVLALGVGSFVVKRLEQEIDMSVVFVSAEKLSLEQALPQEAKIQGNEDARVTVVEFTDMNCPACRAAHPNVERLFSEYGGRMRLAIRHLPIIDAPGHETSATAALIAELAAEKGMFWKFFGTVMQEGNKERIKTTDGLMATAVDAGLARRDLVALFDSTDDEMKQHSTALLKRVSDDIDAARLLTVDTTPTFIIYAEGQKPKAVSANRLESTLRSQPYAGLLER